MSILTGFLWCLLIFGEFGLHVRENQWRRIKSIILKLMHIFPFFFWIFDKEIFCDTVPCNENGISQSPINVITQKTKRAVFKPFRNVGKVRRLREVTMLNNGHTVKVLPNEETSRAVITSGPMQADLYKFVEMHFHWGSNDSRGAEHQINNQVYGA